MTADALDEYICATGAKRDQLRWPAFVTAWHRIGKDFALGWVWWHATGESLHDWTYDEDLDPFTTARCRAWLANYGGVDMSTQPNPLAKRDKDNRRSGAKESE